MTRCELKSEHPLNCQLTDQLIYSCFYRGFIVTILLSSILHYSSLVDDPKVDLSIYLGYSNAHLLFSHLEPVYKSICRPIHIFCGPNIDLSDIFENTKIFLAIFELHFGPRSLGEFTKKWFRVQNWTKGTQKFSLDNYWSFFSGKMDQMTQNYPDWAFEFSGKSNLS